MIEEQLTLNEIRQSTYERKKATLKMLNDISGKQIQTVSENDIKEFFANHTLKVRGGKFVSRNSSGSYIISASSQNIILELTNTTTGKIKMYELFNVGFGEAKTVKVTTSNKVTAYTAGKQTVTYKIPNEDIGKYSYVMVTPDMVQKEKNEEPAILQSLSLKSIGTPIEISGKSTFDLVVEQTTDEHGVYVEILPFHYKFNITFGYLNEKNQFIAETKPLPVSLMVKEPGKTKTQVLSLKKQYTMGEMEEDITLQLNNKGKIVMLYGLTNDNIKGKSSDMTDSFVLEGNSLRLKESISGNGSLQGKYSGWIEGGLYMDDQGQIGYIEPVKITVKK